MCLLQDFKTYSYIVNNHACIVQIGKNVKTCCTIVRKSALYINFYGSLM